MAKLSSDLFTVHLRHRDVEHENVGAQFFDARQAFFTASRLAPPARIPVRSSRDARWLPE